MNALMFARPALSGLFSKEITFENIKPDDCIRLLERELAKNQIYASFLQDSSSDGYHIVHKGFEALRVLPSWSNARDVKTLAKRMVLTQLDMMLEMDGQDVPTLSVADAASCMTQMIRMQLDRNISQGIRANKNMPRAHKQQGDSATCAPAPP